MHNKDVIFAANAQSVEITKFTTFLNALISVPNNVAAAGVNVELGASTAGFDERPAAAGVISHNDRRCLPAAPSASFNGSLEFRDAAPTSLRLTGGRSWTDGAGRRGFEGQAVLDLAAISRDGMMVMGPGLAVANWEPAIAPAALAAAALAIP